MKGIVGYTFQFILLVAVQVLILNNVELLGYMNPYLYLIFLLILPADIGRNALLIIAFLLGLSIDIFENSGGLHTSATLLLAFLRPALFKLIAGPSNTELERFNIKTLGVGRFLLLAGIAVFIHHFWLFLLESFSLKDLLQVIKRTFFSGLFTLLLIYLTQLLVYRKEE
jgi:rod shape-determining protein MreD